MTAELVGRFPDQSAEWYAAREGCIGGSDIASVVGESPWTSRFTLWYRKAGRLTEEPESDAMNWGKRLEPAICRRWQEDYPQLHPMPGGTYRNVERPWQIANPDLLVSDEPDGEPCALLEVKTASAFVSFEWGKSGSDLYPRYYADQVQWYLDVFGLPLAYLVVLIGGSDYRCYEIRYDAVRAAWLRAQGEEFLQTISDGIPPELDGSESTYEAVRELHPDIDSGGEVDLTAEQWLGYLAIKEAAEDAVEAERLAKAELMEHMGSARYGLFCGEKVVRREARGQGRPYLKVIPQPKENVA